MISNRLHLFFPILVAVTLAASCTEGSRSGDGDSSSEPGTDLGGASGIGGSEATGKLGSPCEAECLNGLICSSGECQDPEVLISLSIVVRTVQNHTDGLSVVGENLLPYDIEIDNLRFY